MKYTAAISILTIAIAIGSIPLIFSRSERLKSPLEYCNGLTNGLFLAVGLTHLLPESISQYILAAKTNSPWTIIAICIMTIAALRIIENIGNTVTTNYNNNSHWLSYLLILVFSLHSILEGLILGFELNPQYEMTIFIAIMAHKGAEALSLITNMITHGFSRYKTIFYLVFFSLTTPLGILIGKNMIDLNMTGSNSEVIAFFNSMAAGTFIYIALTNNTCLCNKNVNSFLMAIGFLFMTLISILI